MRAFNASFSSRAAAAIALTASNSSRPTKSAPAIHSRIFSRAEDSASRPIPAMVPAKPFTIFTKSSNILFSDCIGQSPFRRANRGSRANSATLAAGSIPAIPSYFFVAPSRNSTLPSGPVIGLGSIPSTRQPCVSTQAAASVADPPMHCGIADDPALPDFLAPGLELRLDQRDQLRAGLGQLERRFEHLGEADEARVANDDVDRLGDDRASRYRALVCSWTMTRGSWRSFQASWLVPTSTA